MSKARAVIFTGLAIGVLAAGLLWWLWREDARAVTLANATPPTHPAQPAAMMPSIQPVAPSPASSVHPLLAALMQALAREEVRQREALLTFKDDAAFRRFLQRASAAGVSVLGQVNRLRAVRVRLDSPAGLDRDLLENAADYDDVTANGLVRIPSAPPRDQRFAANEVPFGNESLAFIGATGDRREWGRGTTIAILDTGIAADPTFGLGRVRALDVGLGTMPGADNVKVDGHGTAVAALAAGASSDAPGVAPAASLLSIRVTDASGVSDLFTISQAIVAAVDAGAKILNVSLGGYVSGPMLNAAIDYAAQHGAVIVAAAGNDQAAQLAWPAADPRVISVGAVDKAEQQVSFSNSGAQLQLTAPGYGVQTAWLDGQRVYVDGTSASAPLVAGAIAVLMSQNPNLTARQAAELLTRTANDTGAPGADPAFGRGIVNLATALNSSNLGYVDTAVSSHFYDAATNQMQFVVQNRSGRTITGMTLQVSGTGMPQNMTVPSLAPGEIYVAKVPVNEVALRTAGRISFTTQLTNPAGVTDQVPANNVRSSVLAPPKP